MKPSLPLLFGLVALPASGVLETCQAVETLPPGWSVVEIPEGGTKPSFDFDGDDRIHVMGMTEEDSGLVWHAVADSLNSTWTVTTVANGYFYGPGDLRVDADGRAHLAYHDHNAQNPHHVRVFPDGGFTNHPINTPGTHDGWDNALTIDPAGNLHQASVNPSGFGALDSLEYGSFDGSSWSFEGAISGSGSFMYGLNTAIAVDGMGQAHILYCSGTGWTTPGNLKYAVKSKGSWSVSEVTTGSDPRGRFPSIAIGSDATVHAAWLDIDGLDTTHATVMYATLGGGGWSAEPVAELSNVQMGFNHARKSVSLALDSMGVPHIAFSDTGVIRFGTRSAGGWDLQTVLEDDALPYKSLVVLRLDSSDVPGIVFWQPAMASAGRIRLLRPGALPRALLDLVIHRLDGSKLIELEWDSEAGSSYTVERSVDLVTWQALATEPGNGEGLNYHEPIVVGTSAYYRILVGQGGE